MIRERLLATLASVFGAVALTLACIGLYGLLAFAVAGRTAEFGVRMALGANRGDVVFMVLREALWLLAAGGTMGVLIGVAAARLAGRQIEGLLFGLKVIDPLSIAGAFVVDDDEGQGLPNRRSMEQLPLRHRRFAASACACFKSGTSVSACFHRARKSW